METLTRLVVGMSRFGDHLLKQKVGGIIVASLAFACGAGLAHALKSEPRPACAAAAQVKPADPARAEVSMSDTRAVKSEDADADEAEGEEAIFEGTYVNYAYGYSVEIPAGMVGVGATPPAPQHGFGIDLDRPRSIAWMSAPGFPKSYIYADGSANSLEWKRLDAAVKSHLSFLREKGKNVRVMSRTATSLGGLAAVRVVAQYVEGDCEMVSDEVVSIGGGIDAVHTLSLSTPLAKYERDRPVLEAMRRSWCLQPVE